MPEAVMPAPPLSRRPLVNHPARMRLHCYRNYHVHLRQLREIQHLLLKLHRMAGCRGMRAFGNTQPPVTRVFGKNTDKYLTIENYRDDTLEQAVKAGFNPDVDWFDFPLYASAETIPSMIEQGAKAGLLKSVKFYPPHGTTGSQSAVSVFHHLNVGNFHAIRDTGLIACFHGEAALLEDLLAPHCPVHEPTALPNYLWYNDQKMNAEALFYREILPRIVDAVTGLKLVGEHVTTPEAVALIRQLQNAIATVCPQHVAYCIGDLLKTLNTYLNCMPLVKSLLAQLTLIQAITDPNNTQFAMGTDDAWHPLGNKMTACGCAAGCTTTLCAPQLYAGAFERWQTGFGVQDRSSPEWRAFEQYMPDEAELFLNLPQNDLATPAGQAAFENFLVHVGDRFHGLPTCEETFVMERTPQTYAPIWLDYEQEQEFMTLNGIQKVKGDWNIQLPTAMAYLKEGKDPKTDKKRLLELHEQRGTTAWSILPMAA